MGGGLLEEGIPLLEGKALFKVVVLLEGTDLIKGAVLKGILLQGIVLLTAINRSPVRLLIPITESLISVLPPYNWVSLIS